MKKRVESDESAEDRRFMSVAMKEAARALEKDEVPIGAVIVSRGKVVAKGHNVRESASDPLGHAEIIAIKKAAKKLGAWRLSGVTIYVTLEPCLMCMGAIINSRIDRVVFAAFDPKAGACGSLYDVSQDKRLNHRVAVASGVLENESSQMLKGFFKALRQRKKA